MMATMKQPIPEKDKLAITSNLLKMETTFAAKPEGITMFEEPRHFSHKEETEKTMKIPDLAQLICASTPDKLVPITMVPAIRDPSGFFAMVHTCAMLECWTPCRTLSPTQPP